MEVVLSNQFWPIDTANMASDFARTNRAAISNPWSWWWEGSNHKDELARAVLTFSVVIILTLWYAWVIKKSKKGKFPLPPGPRGLPFIGNLPFIDPDLHSYFAKLSGIYGPIFKLQLGGKLCVVLSSPALAKEVLRDYDTIFANRDAPVSAVAITYGGLDMVWASYGPHWRMVRKICVQEILSKTSLDARYALRQQEVRRTVREVYSKIDTPINIADQMFLTIFNVTTSMLWGGTLKGEERSSVGAEFRQVTSEANELMGKTNVSDFFPVLARFDIQGLERQMKRLLSSFDRIFDSIIDQRLKLDKAEGEAKSNNEESTDFLQVLLHLKDQGDPKTPFTIIHLKALLLDIVTAGTETTSTTVEWAMAEMMKHPEIMKEAQEELENVVGRNNMVEESHLPKLHYLDAVLKETLRLHPVGPLLLPRCPSQTCTVGGYTIPRGTQVFINAWAIQRHPEIWDNSLKFQPERFLRATSKWDYSGNDFRYIPFGSGRRMCVGISLAERMVPYVLATLLHSFEWRLPEGTDLDFSEKFGIVLKKKAPLIAIPTPRLSNPELYC